MFSQKKFLSLPRKRRAKKLADLLLRSFIDETVLTEYNQLVDWLGASAYPGPPDDVHRRMELYVHWRREAGLGLEGSVAERLSEFTPDNPDREAPTRAPRPWEVLLHNLRSGHNTGAIIRTADCLGFRRVHLSGYTPDLDNRALRSAAMGAESWVPCTRWDSPFDCLDDLPRDFATIALETTPTAVAIDAFAWPQAGLLMLGNEELGIAPELLRRADAVVAIPLFGRKASLNVSNAFAATAWEMVRSSI